MKSCYRSTSSEAGRWGKGGGRGARQGLKGASEPGGRRGENKNGMFEKQVESIDLKIFYERNVNGKASVGSNRVLFISLFVS